MLLTNFVTMAIVRMNEAEDLESLEWTAQFTDNYLSTHGYLLQGTIPELEQKLGRLVKAYHQRKKELQAKVKPKSLVEKSV